MPYQTIEEYQKINNADPREYPDVIKIINERFTKHLKKHQYCHGCGGNIFKGDSASYLYYIDEDGNLNSNYYHPICHTNFMETHIDTSES